MSYQTQYTFTTGLLTTKTQAAGTPSADTTTYTYDPVTDGVAQQTKAAGTTHAETTSTAYNEGSSTGSLTDMTSQSDGHRGHSSTTSYNGTNEPVDMTNAANTTDSVVTENGYEGNGDVSAITQQVR